MTQDILGFETQVSHEGPAREIGSWRSPGCPVLGTRWTLGAALDAGERRGGQTLFAPQSPRVAESRILKQLPCGGASVPCAFCFLRSGYFGH